MESTSKTLIKLLELGQGHTNDRKRIVESLPKELEDKYHGEVVKRELLLSEAVERTGLIQTFIADTVIEGAKYMVCMREACPIIRMQSDATNVPYGDAGIYAPQVSEGADFPAMYQNYSYVALTAKKYGHIVPISQEMVDDCKFDIAAIELKKGGQAIENTLNRVMLDSLIANAGLEHDTAGADQGIKAVTASKGKVMNAGFIPDVFIMHPEMWVKVFDDYKPAYNPLAEQTLRSGVPPEIVGLKPFVLGITATTATYWDYDTDGDFGGLIMDSQRGSVIGMRQDITVKYVDDPFKMLVGPRVHARFDGSYVNANALCRVEF